MMVKIKVIVTYQRFFSLARIKVFLWHYYGEKPEYPEKTLSRDHKPSYVPTPGLEHNGERHRH